MGQRNNNAMQDRGLKRRRCRSGSLEDGDSRLPLCGCLKRRYPISGNTRAGSHGTMVIDVTMGISLPFGKLHWMGDFGCQTRVEDLGLELGLE